MTTPNEGNENNEPNNETVIDPNAPKTFTQEQVDTMNAKTRRDTEAKYSDHAELLVKADELSTLQHANLTKEEQLTAERDEARNAKAESDSRADNIELRSEIRARAAELGFVNSADAMALVDRSGISRTEDGIVGVDDALNALLESSPYLRKSEKPNAPNLNGGPQNAGAPPVTLTDGEREMAHKLFASLPHAEGEAEYAKGKRPK